MTGVTIWPLSAISSSEQSASIKKRGYPCIMSVKSDKKDIKKSLWLFPTQSKTCVVNPRSRRWQDGFLYVTVESPKKKLSICSS